MFFLMIVLPSCSSSCCGTSSASTSSCGSSCTSCGCTGCDDLRDLPDAYVPNDAFLLLPDAARPPDARIIDADLARTTCGEDGELGGHCTGGDCFEPWACVDEASGVLPSVTRADATLPGRPYTYFLASVCSGVCGVDYPNQCNPCSRCVDTGQRESGVRFGECSMTCEADLTSRGGCVGGFGCERGELVCRPACVVTVDGVDSCQFTIEDRDTDPRTHETIVDEGVDFPRECNEMTGLCQTVGRADASAGDDCTTDFDCEDDGTCIRSDASEPVSTLSDGYCIRRGCNEADLACRADDVCAHTVFDLPGGVCMQQCDVGAETSDAERLGVSGGNPQCGVNEACFWADARGATSRFDGACWPGNYNDEPSYDVGSACREDADCYSPFGLGRCLFVDDDFGISSAIGICAIAGCGLDPSGVPGLRTSDVAVTVPTPSDLCRTSAVGGRDACISFTPSTSYCVAGCDSADSCPDGYACTPLGDSRFCWPACTADADCRAGARCLASTGGPCDPGRDLCVCDDLAPPIDASVADPDAGTADDATTEDTGPIADDAASEDAP